MQVLLHLLRAGYAAVEAKQGFNNGAHNETLKQHPIRAIYFESPDAFPEIDSFTLETAALLVSSGIHFSILYHVLLWCFLVKLGWDIMYLTDTS